METIWTELAALGGVILIDVALAADNAVVVGMAAAGLPVGQRRKAVIWGIAAAAVLRIIFAIAATWLLALGWFVLVGGGLLLVWVSWKLYREIVADYRHRRAERQAAAAVADATGEAPMPHRASAVPKTMRQAIIQIVIADVSMSLDNVLAVAGLAGEHTWVLIVGLSLSVILMGVAASFIVGLLNRFPWLSVAGLAVIVFVAGRMIYEGIEQMTHPEDEPTAVEEPVDEASLGFPAFFAQAA
jgi:YjbE family integral membrane protein